MQITIAAATRLEIQEDTIRQSAGHGYYFLYTGVGILSSAVQLTRHVVQHRPSLVIQAGIAGSLSPHLPLGEVVIVGKECLGDTGVWEKGEWKDLFDMGFQPKDEVPFTHQYLENPNTATYNVLQLPQVTGVTVNQVTTAACTLQMLQTKYGAQLESMEGAALHYVCSLLGVPFIQVRAVSNYVGERDKSKWRIHEAISNLNATVARMLQHL